MFINVFIGADLACSEEHIETWTNWGWGRLFTIYV